MFCLISHCCLIWGFVLLSLSLVIFEACIYTNITVSLSFLQHIIEHLFKKSGNSVPKDEKFYATMKNLLFEQILVLHSEAHFSLKSLSTCFLLSCTVIFCSTNYIILECLFSFQYAVELLYVMHLVCSFFPQIALFYMHLLQFFFDIHCVIRTAEKPRFASQASLLPCSELCASQGSRIWP